DTKCSSAVISFFRSSPVWSYRVGSIGQDHSSCAVSEAYAALMYSLFRQHLSHHPCAPSMNLSHALRQLGCQLPAAQVNVQKGRLDTSVPSEHRDLLNVPIRPRKVGKAQVPRGVRGELQDS